MSPPRELIGHGAEGAQVADIQERLVRLGASGVTVDGVFDGATREAVRRFQRDRGLAADGVVGPETWRTLVEAGFSLGDRLLWHTLPMMRGDDVRALQHQLNRLGFDAGAEDGIFGPLATAAVEEFQRNVGLEVDGVVGPRTVEALRRLHRAHQSPGLAIRVREREVLRRISGRGLSGLRVVLDPAYGPGAGGPVGPAGTRAADLVWSMAVRTSARLVAHGVDALLTRGPTTTPGLRARARFANEQGADLVVGISLNALDTPAARGAASYYFGAPGYVSEAGLRLAEAAQEELVAAGFLPDCRVHPMTWTMLRETRMPAAVVEPGFITCAEDEARLSEPLAQEAIARALTEAIRRLLGATPTATEPVHA